MAERKAASLRKGIGAGEENPAGFLHPRISCGASPGREDDRYRFTVEFRLNFLKEAKFTLQVV